MTGSAYPGTIKMSTQIAFVNADFRNFQNTPAKNETRVNSILIPYL